MSARPAEAPEPDEIPENQKHALLLAGLLTTAFVLFVLVIYEYTKPRPGNLIFPGGVTYLGDRSANPSPKPAIPVKTLVRLSVAPDTAWKTFTGKANPFRFSYPETVNVALYPNAETETVVIRVGQTNPTEYAFLTVLDMAKGNVAPYRGKVKDLVGNFAGISVGIKSVGEIRPFTNVNGLKGYRTTLEKMNGDTEENIFFEVTGRPDRVVRLVNTIMDESLFSRVVDSVGWGTK